MHGALTIDADCAKERPGILHMRVLASEQHAEANDGKPDHGHVADTSPTGLVCQPSDEDSHHSRLSLHVSMRIQLALGRRDLLRRTAAQSVDQKSAYDFHGTSDAGRGTHQKLSMCA